MTRARDVANIDGILTTTGDTFYASSGGTPARLGIGSTGQVLTVASGLPSWATPTSTAFSGVHLTKANNQSCATGAQTMITFDTEQYDTNSYHNNSTNTTRITIPTTGYYTVLGYLFMTNNSSGIREFGIFKNGTPLSYTDQGGAGATYPPSGLSISEILYLTAGDYLELNLYQTSGSALNALSDGNLGGAYGCKFIVQSLGA